MASLLAADPPNLRNVGTIYSKNWLSWDQSDPKVTHYRIYIAPTNQVILGAKYVSTNSFWMTNAVGSNFVVNPFLLLGDVPTNRWPGALFSSGLNGTWAVAATAVAPMPFTNIVGTNLTVVTNLIESDFSEVISLTFRDGAPVSPVNFQLYSVLLFAGTNAIPSLFPPELAPSGR